MASVSSIPRFLLPRGGLIGKNKLPTLYTLQRSWLNNQRQISANQYCRNASSSSAKPKVLEKPTKFTPPSHPQRIRNAPPRQYGPALTQQELSQQKNKQYPNMMPPEGSLMHWFLTTRWIHVWITMSVLFTLAAWTLKKEFERTSPYYDMLPFASDFLYHPFSSMGQALEVYKMHTAHTSAETAERRKRKLEEVQKRRAYRVAHGLEKADSQGMEMSEEGAVAVAGSVPGDEGEGEGREDGKEGGGGGKGEYVDFEGRKRPIKKWLGIW